MILAAEGGIGYSEVLVGIILFGVIVVPIAIIVWRVMSNTAGDGGLYGSPYAPPPEAPATPDGWYPDPAGAHQERWYRAGTWTAQVRDDGVVTDDSL